MYCIPTYRLWAMLLISTTLISCSSPLTITPGPHTPNSNTTIDTIEVVGTSIPLNATESISKVPTAIPSNNASSTPTMSTEERNQLINALLSPTEGCTLPCWWGVSPGETPWDDAKFQLEQKGLKFKSFTLPLDTRIGYSAGLYM